MSNSGLRLASLELVVESCSLSGTSSLVTATTKVLKRREARKRFEAVGDMVCFKARCRGGLEKARQKAEDLAGSSYRRTCKRRFVEYDCRIIIPTQINAKTTQVLKTTSPSAPKPRPPNGKSNQAFCEKRVRNDPAIVTPLPAIVALTKFG